MGDAPTEGFDLRAIVDESRDTSELGVVVPTGFEPVFKSRPCFRPIYQVLMRFCVRNNRRDLNTGLPQNRFIGVDIGLNALAFKWCLYLLFFYYGSSPRSRGTVSV